MPSIRLRRSLRAAAAGLARRLRRVVLLPARDREPLTPFDRLALETGSRSELIRLVAAFRGRKPRLRAAHPPVGRDDG